MQSVSLNQRRARHELSLFLEATAISLKGGFDLAHAWPHTLSQLGDRLENVRPSLMPSIDDSFALFLKSLSRNYPVREHRLWFTTIAELYESGGSLSPLLKAISKNLREEEERDWQNHVKNLPIRMSLILALFFLPAALLLVFSPLLAVSEKRDALEIRSFVKDRQS